MHIKKISALVVGSAGLMGCCSAADAARKPNILFIHLDDLDFNELGFYAPNHNVLTPYLDGIISGGMRFERGYVVSTVCVPTRYSTLTGKYPGANNYNAKTVPPDRTISYENWNIWGMNGSFIEENGGEKTMAHFLKDLGYKTAMVGKYHNDRLSMRWPYLYFGEDPQDPEVARQVRDLYETTRARIQRQTGFDVVDRLYWENKESFPVEALHFDNTPWITEGAVNFIRSHVHSSPDEPFFLYYASPLPHGLANPGWNDQEYPMKINMEVRDARATPAGMLPVEPSIQPPRQEVLQRVADAGLKRNTALMSWLDDSIGVLLKTLKEEGLDENTVIIVLSDHRSDGKRNLYDNGCRVPFIIKWPGTVPPGSINRQLVASIDLLPTMIDIAGGNPREFKSLNGVSLLPTLRDTSVPVRKDLLLEVGFARAVVTDQHKYIALRFPDYATTMQESDEVIWDGSRRKGRKWYEKIYPHYTENDQLFDLQKDPEEKINLYGDPESQDVVKDMHKRLQSYLQAMPHSFGEFNSHPVSEESGE